MANTNLDITIRAKNMADRAFKRLGSQIERAQRLARALGKAIKKSFAYATLGVTALAGVGIALAKLGMDAVESENLFKESFQGMADAAREWSEELSKRLGLNAFKIREQSALLYVMANSMGVSEDAAFAMSKGLTELAYDMASFYNLKPWEAFDKLRAGISGESEPLKRLGILVLDSVIRQTEYAKAILATGRELTEAEKVMARYQAIMEQTSKAQGDLARTANSPTNILRKLKEQIVGVATKMGITIVESDVFKAALAKIGDVVDRIVKSGKLVEWTQKVISGLKGIISFAQDAYKVLSAFFLGSWEFKVSVFKDLGDILLSTLSAAWKAFTVLAQGSMNFIFKPVFLALRKEFATLMVSIGKSFRGVPLLENVGESLMGSGLDLKISAQHEARAGKRGGLSQIDEANKRAIQQWQKGWEDVAARFAPAREKLSALPAKAEAELSAREQRQRIPAMQKAFDLAGQQIVERLNKLRGLDPDSMMARSIEAGIVNRLGKRERIAGQIAQIDASVKIDLNIENYSGSDEDEKRLRKMAQEIVDDSITKRDRKLSRDIKVALNPAIP